MTALTDDIRSALKTQLTARPAAPSREYARRYKYAPHASEALAINPADIPRATATLRAHGCMVEYDSAGRPVITSERQYKEIGKAFGFWNGREGFRSYDEDGNRVLTGREQVQAREEFKRALARGEVKFD